MSKTLIQDVVTLIKEGWRPYNAEPDAAVYNNLRCGYVLRGRNKSRPYWFVRADVFLCLGCAARCMLKHPVGFPPPLPIKYSTVPPAEPFVLTPQELLARRELLTVQQAAYCLNVSVRKIYGYIAEGRLTRLKDLPVRVRAAEVRDLCQDFDE